MAVHATIPETRPPARVSCRSGSHVCSFFCSDAVVPPVTSRHHPAPGAGVTRQASRLIAEGSPSGGQEVEQQSVHLFRCLQLHPVTRAVETLVSSRACHVLAGVRHLALADAWGAVPP